MKNAMPLGVLKVFIRSIKNPLDQQNKDETKQAIKHP
jgi:hypothetical protein